MSGKYALIIANTEYTDPGLAQLSAPGKDAKELGRVLNSPDICAFDDVIVLNNEIASKVSNTIENFLSDRIPRDLLVLYFSGHAVWDEDGSLYLAVKNTNRAQLHSTAIKCDFIREAMDQSRSQRQVLILDCFNSGAFTQSTKAKVGGSVGTAAAFRGTGAGRIVISASDSIQFAWEGDQIIGEADDPLFTDYLVRGLEGEADTNRDGRITLDELYDYAYEKIANITPNQTPGKWSYELQEEIVLRQNVRTGDDEPFALPEDLLSAMNSFYPYIREGAVSQLDLLLRAKNRELARSARIALERIAAEDDSRRVAEAAAKALERSRPLGQAPSKAGTDLSTSPRGTPRLRREKEEETKLMQEKAEREKRLQGERRNRKEIEAQRKGGETSQPVATKSRLNPVRIGVAVVAILAIGYAAIRFLPSLLASAPTATPRATQLSVAFPVATERLATSTTIAPTQTATEVVTMTASAPPFEIVDSKGMAMVFVPAGDFMMGTDTSDAADERPSHTVFLDGYYIDKFEVTNAHYKACVDAGRCDPPKHPYFFPGGANQSYYGNSQYDNYPVVYLDWNMARAYCDWRGANLPTEAQWEKAARGDSDERIYPWGDNLECQQANYLKCVNRTSEVGSYGDGKSPYGAYDMTGNVLEWVADWYSANYYQDLVPKNPTGPTSGQSRVLRGGSWTKFDVRVTNRIGVAPDTNTFDIGFRCASPVP